MRGFLGYLTILTGFVVVGTGVNLFVTPTPEAYIRLAAIVSLAGFLIGFKPALFRRVEGTVIGKVITETQTVEGVVTQTVEGPAQVVAPAPAAPAEPTAEAKNGPASKSALLAR